MKKVFLDTNIILDIMAQRKPFNVPANAIMKMGINEQTPQEQIPVVNSACFLTLFKQEKN